MTRLDLKITKKDCSDGRIQLSITVPAKLTDGIIKAATFTIAAMQNRINIQGVEEDAVEGLVIEKVGEPAYNAFLTQFAMANVAPFAVTEKALEIVMDPQTETREDFTRDKDFSFVAFVTPKPTYELDSYDPVTVKLPRPTVTDEEVEAQIYGMAERFAETTADEGAIAEIGKELVFSIDTKDKATGEKIDNLTATRRIYTIGEGFLPQDFDKGIEGMKPGETRTFDWGLPGMEGTEPKPVTSTVGLTQVNKRIVPAITDAWVSANMPEAKDLAGLKKMIYNEGIEFKTRELEEQKLFYTASALAERFKGSISDELYEHTRANMLQGMQQQLEQQGMTLEQYFKQMGMEEQQFSMSLMMQVRETLRQGFALDALARHLKLTISDADIEDAFRRIAPGNEERAKQEYEGTGRMYLVTEAALRTKANKWLVETATFEYPEDAKA